MSQPQRVVSNPIELQKLSIVDKQSRKQEDQNSSSRNASPTRLAVAAPIHAGTSSPRRQGIQISLPIESSPSKDIDTGDSSSMSSTTPKRGSVSSDHNPALQQQQQYQDLLFKLAAKKRQIVELEQELQAAKKDLTILETKYRYIVSDPQASPNLNMNAEPKNEMIQNWSKRVQKTLDEVNNSPNVLKSKKSISNFFNGDPLPNTSSPGISSNTMTKPVPPPRPSPRTTNSRPPPPPRPRSKEYVPQARQGFLQNLRDKFNEFTVAEEEEEEFDRTQNKHKDDFYLKEKLDYDDDEEVETEAVGGTLLGDHPKSVYKR